MKRLVLAVVALAPALLGGCAGISAAREFRDVEPIHFASGDSTWRVFDKPAENRLMITPTLGRSISIGANNGASNLGLSERDAAKAEFQAAAADWLAKSGRQCQILSGEDILDPQWEFKYRCDPAV